MGSQDQNPGFIPVAAGDAEMLAAIRQAQQTFPEFVRELQADYRRAIPALAGAMVKVYFTDPDQSPETGEHMWVNEIDFDGQLIHGTLASSPGHLQSVRHGDRVTFSNNQITDWLYVVGDKAHGAFTINLLRSRMSPAERQQHDNDYPFSFE